MGRRPLLILLSLAMTCSTFVLVILATSAEAPANADFGDTWARTDKPVLEGDVSRTWMWGPEAFTGPLWEPYAESPNGQRQVQYFDKSRMEITNPAGNPDADWYVTNGLLVVELVTGNMQVGHNEFEERQPAQTNVAGDPDDQNAPTYATVAELEDAFVYGVNHVYIDQIDRAGTITRDESLAQYGVNAAVYVRESDHTVASVFWEFMISAGTVYEDGQLVIDSLFPHAYYATGLPIMEPYWTEIKVAGTTKLVLLQCFERRCLTYTPDNPEGWQVEAGNVGQHYYQWRYESGGDVPEPAPTSTPTPTPTPPPPPPPPPEPEPDCHSSYPTVCIPPPPPDLDCGDISYRNFTVVGSDPHRFDGDDDGVGCES